MTARFEGLQAENAEIQLKNNRHDEKFQLQFQQISIGNKQSPNNKNNGPLAKALDQPPSTCQEWLLDASPVRVATGIYMVKWYNP